MHVEFPNAKCSYIITMIMMKLKQRDYPGLYLDADFHPYPEYSIKENVVVQSDGYSRASSQQRMVRRKRRE